MKENDRQDARTDHCTDGTDRPMRDVSARTAIGSCDHCGGNANSTLDGEHIWKCSEIVPVEAIERYIDNLRHNTERRTQYNFNKATADQIADELEELIRSVEPDTDRTEVQDS